MSWWSHTREWLRGAMLSRHARAETREEMRFHLEMEAAERARVEGIDAAEARRQAMIAFGGEDKHVEAVREARGLGWLSGFSLDMKLGARMLVKYPGLTLAGGLAIAIAVALAASFFEFVLDMVKPRHPLEDPNRVVVVQNIDQATSANEPRSLYDFQVWREEVQTISNLSAATSANYQVTTAAGRFEELRAARVTPSIFAMLGAEQPLLGRTLEDADMQEGAPLAVVLGYDAWQLLFDGDRAAVGRDVRVDDVPGVVVGVMPERFGFPVNQQMWVPLRERARADQRRMGPPIVVYGRLAAGRELEEAQAELATLGRRAAAESPKTHERLVPRVQRLGDAQGMGALVTLMNVPFFLFLIVVCANVSTLVFARTATRASELAVRSALGASRKRLVIQLIAEALVLTCVAAAVGLAAAQWGTKYAMALFWEVQQTAPPYWYDPGLSSTTMMYSFLLVLIAATIIGGMPALKATGRQLRSQIVQAGGGGAGLRFGRVSTAVIMVQVALCVAFLPLALMQAKDMFAWEETASNFPAEEYLSGTVALVDDGFDAATADDSVRTIALFQQVRQRVSEQPGVMAAAYISRIPGFNHPRTLAQLEADTAVADFVRVAGVDERFLDMVGVKLVAGRLFSPAEYTSGARVLLVEEEWATAVMPGRSPIGQRVRFLGGGDLPSVSDASVVPVYEIVGVITGFEEGVNGPGSNVEALEPLRFAAGESESVQLYARMNTPPAPRVRDIHSAVTSVDPKIRIHELKPLEEIWRPVLKSGVYLTAGINAVGAIILMFALVGIYALMSFTVAQRGREIAIRAALGANPRSIVVSIFRRAIMQIGGGILAGAAVISFVVAEDPVGLPFVAAVAVLMMFVGISGCLLPARRALRIHPTEALKGQ
jgi:predicted permease